MWRLPPRLQRHPVRRSTLLMLGGFLAVLAIYILVRPAHSYTPSAAPAGYPPAYTSPSPVPTEHPTSRAPRAPVSTPATSAPPTATTAPPSASPTPATTPTPTRTPLPTVSVSLPAGSHS